MPVTVTDLHMSLFIIAPSPLQSISFSKAVFLWCFSPPYLKTIQIKPKSGEAIS